MKRLVILAAMLLSGCGEPVPYTVRFVRPDGETHRTITVVSHMEPFLVSPDGATYLEVVEGRRYLVPLGWMVEVDQALEAGEK